MTDTQPTEAMVDNIAISIHYADGDPATVKWAKQPGKYRASLRRDVRDVLAAMDRLGVRFPPSTPQSPDKERGETPAPAEMAPWSPDEVINLVIAAREAFDCAFLPEEEGRTLDKALEPFSSKVRYANEPNDEAALKSEGSE